MRTTHGTGVPNASGKMGSRQRQRHIAACRRVRATGSAEMSAGKVVRWNPHGMAPRDDPDQTPPVLLDPAARDWVLVSGAGFSFEPWGAEFAPPEPGAVVVAIAMTGDGTRHRGVEVSVLDERRVSVWMPTASAAYWLPDSARDTAPWETHLVPLDYERGQLA